ncbi:MAG: DUF4236 domain-containing protein [Candidatus Dormibacteria bacterium]
MGYLRFRRRLKVAPGVTLNLGKRGVSASAGVRGAHVTAGRGTRATVGIPGTGLSYTSLVKHNAGGGAGGPPTVQSIGCLGWLAIVVALSLAVVGLAALAPLVVPVGIVLAGLVLLDPSGIGDRIHAWRAWRFLPGLHARSTALGFAAVMSLYLIALPATALALLVANPKPAPVTPATAGPTSIPSQAVRTATPKATLAPTASPTPVPAAVPAAVPTPAPTAAPTAVPIAAPTADPLAGVTAICNDGTYSYSAHRSGTCSKHGGVRQWINYPPS